jgi:hypothetical protein
MQWEDSFNALVRNNTTNGNCFIDATTFSTDENALENLHTFLIAFDNGVVHIDGVTDTKVWEEVVRSELVSRD